MGPMFAGKTTELLKLKDRAEIAGRKCLLIKYCQDTRYSSNTESVLVTHSHQSAVAVVSAGKSLQQTLNSINYTDYHVILIDEIQFYDDGAEVCDQLANKNHQVIVSGLNGDYLRQPFTTISKLIPKIEQITYLTAIDSRTGRDASFSMRITTSDTQEVIGGAETYQAVDRSTYNIVHNSINKV